MALGDSFVNVVSVAVFVTVYLPVIVALAALSSAIAMFFVEIVAAVATPHRSATLATPTKLRPRIAVLVPAHNESIGLIPTLADSKAQLRPTDRLVVVADNCSDDTAEVARGEGAETIERLDADRRGKGYALSAGVAHLAADAPEVVVIIDADCRLEAQTIESLTAVCVSQRRPTQANYIMTAPARATLHYGVPEFAWRVKNFVRPLGLSSLGLPCQLTGSGMAFPWSAIRSAELATGNIVEDMALGIELALRGYPPIFCPAAVVTSRFPVSKKGLETQRHRWEHGHFQTIVRFVWPLIFSGAANRSFAQIGLALDLAIPPLSALALVTLAIVALCYALRWFGFSAVPFYVAVVDAVVFLWAVALAWLRYGQDVLPIGALPKVAPYLMGKVHLYQSILRAKGPAVWKPTDRK